MSIRLTFLFLVFGCGLPATHLKAQDAKIKEPRHDLIYYTRQLQEHIGRDNTDYRHKNNVVGWGEKGSVWECYADCSGLVNALLAHTYGLSEADFERLFGHRRMYAYHYYDAIKAEKHFRLIRNIHDIRPGDLIALDYPDAGE